MTALFEGPDARFAHILRPDLSERSLCGYRPADCARMHTLAVTDKKLAARKRLKRIYVWHYATWRRASAGTKPCPECGRRGASR